MTSNPKGNLSMSSSTIAVNPSVALAPPDHVSLPSNHPLIGSGIEVMFTRQGSTESSSGCARLPRRAKAFIQKIQSVAGQYGIMIIREEAGQLEITTRTGIRATNLNLFMEQTLAEDFS
jgi:hypothetical protein